MSTDNEGQRRQQAKMARQHVFVVNGAPSCLDVIRELLQSEHYNVTTTNFMPRTFEQIAALEPALLMVDLVVGKQAGWGLLDRLHAEAQTRGVPEIVFSTNPGATPADIGQSKL